MAGRYRTSLKPTLIVTGIFLFWAFDAPTPMGDGGLMIWAPLVAIAAYFVHNMLRWIIR